MIKLWLIFETSSTVLCDIWLKLISDIYAITKSICRNSPHLGYMSLSINGPKINIEVFTFIVFCINIFMEFLFDHLELHLIKICSYDLQRIKLESIYFSQWQLFQIKCKCKFLPRLQWSYNSPPKILIIHNIENVRYVLCED